MFEVVDLACEGGFSDAEVFGGVTEVGMSGNCEEPLDALFGSAGGEYGPHGGGECVGPTLVGEDVLVRGDAAAGRESELASVSSQIGCRDVEVGGDLDVSRASFSWLSVPGLAVKMSSDCPWSGSSRSWQ
ncbi:hypothetical protein GCM10022222_01080 [Amycolatopsis ultiminotia]|uniref:Uncharacterized protein n=1 Tax=Amycolatopsis ultiminotia TaxID=543629 RepID=A0ABP6UWE1_9PSEU